MMRKIVILLLILAAAVILIGDSICGCGFAGQKRAKIRKHTPAPTDYIARWTMDDDADNTTVLDSTETYNGIYAGDACYTSAHAVTGQIDGALSFDGSSNYITFSDDMPAFSEVTITFWIKYTTATQYDILYWHTLSGGPVNEIFLYPKYGGFSYEVGNASPVFASGSCNDDSWHHIAVSHSSATANIYIDGSLEKTQSVAIGIWADGIDYFVIGNYLTDYFDGYIDDFRIYDRALSRNEIESLYEEGT